MSKKDKKRIAELERQQSLLSAKIRVLAHYFAQVLAGKEQPQFEQGSIDPCSPNFRETAKDSPTRDGEKLDFKHVDFFRLGRNWGKSGAGMFKSMFEGQDKTKCAGCQNIENVLNKSTLDKLKQNELKQDKPEQEKPAQTEPITPEKEQELMAQLNAELAKFASLEVFNADRKNFFLPPVGKLEFDKMKAAIECTIAIAKMVRPDYFDKINQIKVPVSEQPEAEPKQSSDGADSPKQEPTFQSQLDQYHEELSDKVASEIIKTAKFWAGIFGLQADSPTRDTVGQMEKEKPMRACESWWKDFSKQQKTKQDELAENKANQPEIHALNVTKLTLNKMVLGRIEEMEKWLGEREYNTNEIAKYIQVCVDNLGLDLADFRRKVLDLGRVEPSKVEPKEAVQPKEKQPETEQNRDGEPWGIFDKKRKTLLLMIEGENFRYSSKQDTENAICRLHNSGQISGKFHDYDAVLVSEITKQIESEQPQTDQPSPEKDGEKQGYIEPKKEKTAWIIQANFGLSGEPLFVKKLYCNTAINDGMKMVCSPSNYKIETTTNKSEAAQYSSFELVKKQIDDIKHLGADKGCKFGRCELREIYAFDLLPETEQKEAEQSGEKLGETDQTEAEKQQFYLIQQQFYLIQMNPKSAERFNAFYLEKLSADGFAIHTPNPNEAMQFVDADAAQTEIDTIIEYGSGRYDADDFKIVEKP